MPHQAKQKPRLSSGRFAWWAFSDFALRTIFLALPLTSKLDALYGGNANLFSRLRLRKLGSYWLDAPSGKTKTPTFVGAFCLVGLFGFCPSDNIPRLAAYEQARRALRRECEPIFSAPPAKTRFLLARCPIRQNKNPDFRRGVLPGGPSRTRT